jgi:hypothetical protein
MIYLVGPIAKHVVGACGKAGSLDDYITLATTAAQCQHVIGLVGDQDLARAIDVRGGRGSRPYGAARSLRMDRKQHGVDDGSLPRLRQGLAGDDGSTGSDGLQDVATGLIGHGDLLISRKLLCLLDKKGNVIMH